MRNQQKRQQSGFTLIEIIIGVAIVAILLNMLNGIVSYYNSELRIERASSLIAKVPLAVQKRSAHDGFLFTHWDTNGGRAATNSTLSWETEAEFETFLGDYLVARSHPGCGNLTDGWNPLNGDGTPVDGPELSMEKTALIGCNELRGKKPFNVDFAAALSDEPNGSMGKFRFYVITEKIDFEGSDAPDNNILNFQKLQKRLLLDLQDKANGTPSVSFGLGNDYEDIDDDTYYTATQCEDELKNGNSCDIVIEIDFSGDSNGQFKTTNNNNSFVDDVTFKSSLADTLKQQCAYWERDTASANGWTGSMVDCAIKAGAGDDDVRLVFDAAQASEFIVTSETDLNYLCDLYEQENVSGLGGAITNNTTPTGQTPCGILNNGGVVQLVTREAHVGRVYADEIVSGPIFANQLNLYTSVSGGLVIQAFNAAQNATVFVVDNQGNLEMQGDLGVDGDATVRQNLTVEGDILSQGNSNFELNVGNSAVFGSSAGTSGGLTMSRNGAGTFSIETRGVSFEILKGNNGEGISLNNNASGEVEIELKANGGVLAADGTTIHGSKSSLMDIDYSSFTNPAANLKNGTSEFITGDLAKMLDDTSSPIQIVGIDRIEGEFTVLEKPNCLWFMDDSLYTNNPYRELIDSGSVDPTAGRELARLVLIPMYFKTYNSAFGDNQIFAQHASHSSSSTWDIYLYMSGEGAFGTGAREDGAGGSLAMTMCDYSGINFSRQSM